MKFPVDIKFVDCDKRLQSFDGEYKIAFGKFQADSNVGYFVIQRGGDDFEIISELVPEDFFHYTCDYIHGLLGDDMFIYKNDLKRLIRKLITIEAWFSGVQCEMTQEEIDMVIV